MSDNMTEYEWVQRALNSLYLELPAPVASDCIPKLKRFIELQDAEIRRLRECVEKAPHGEFCASRGKDPQYPKVPVKCNCWKREALGGRGDDTI